jgi:putative membrane protein insertion efficiency factor
MNSRPHLRVPVARSPNHGVRWFSLVALALIAGYRTVLSPILLAMWGPACRFEPSCSAYAAEAISRYGIAHGGWMALKRLLKCRPLGGWGFDPVPVTDSVIELTSAGIAARREKWNIVG